MNARSRHQTTLMVAGAGVVATALLGAGLHLASSQDEGPEGIALAAGESGDGAVTVSCPSVADKLGNVPAAAQAGVTQELANLERQIVNVNNRLAREPDQAASQLGDIAGKRNAVIERIILNITRVGGTEPPGLKALVQCSLNQGGAGGGGAGAGDDDGAGAGAGAGGGAGNGAGGGAGNGAGGGAGAGDGNGAAGGAQTVNCPTVDDQLPAVPAGAAAEVERNLALLETQIGEANARLARLAVRPEGGANFIQNAILGPLEDKRFATLNRIATAIGRIADRPDELQDLAPCTLNAAGSGGGEEGAGGNDGGNQGGGDNGAGGGNQGGGNQGGGNGAANTVNCPSVENRLPAVPAGAVEAVDKELATLQKQIDEANARLARLAVRPEGGPQFVQNAILGPLEDKRIAVLDRIALDIGRITGVRPGGLDALASCSLNE